MSLILWNVFSPRFYVALTASSFGISILILCFEWWYYSKYGVSFIEQLSLNCFLFGLNCSSDSSPDGEDENCDSSRDRIEAQPIECKVWRNPINLFRGCEYSRLSTIRPTSKEALTFYDMNLSAQDHQTLFTCENDDQYEDLKIMQTAWREREPNTRINSARRAIEINPECVPAWILLAEEDAKTVAEAEEYLLTALKPAEAAYKKGQAAGFSSSTVNGTASPVIANGSNTSYNGSIGSLSNYYQNSDANHRRNLHSYIYVRRRLAMCARRLGKLREAVKQFRDIIKEFNFVDPFNLQENLIEALLEQQAYADVQALLNRCDDINLPKSATICFTAALLKVRAICDKLTPEMITKRGLTMEEFDAVDSIHRAVEFNPHVPLYLLEMKPLILPPEHILKRADSEAVAYSFFHLTHWKRIEGALPLLEATWKATFRLIPNPSKKGHLFFPYPGCECTDRELLPQYHDMSIYPKRETPMIIRFALFLCASLMVFFFCNIQYPEYSLQLAIFIKKTITSITEYWIETINSIIPVRVVVY